MLGFAKAHTILIAWLVAAVCGGLLTVAGPALVLVMADLFLPGAEGVDAAAVLNLLLILFHGSLLAAVVLTVSAILRRVVRR